MSDKTSEELLPCPFCGTNEIWIDRHTYWTGATTRMLSVTVAHRCPSLLQSFLEIKGKTEAEAIRLWNTRASKAETGVHKREEPVPVSICCSKCGGTGEIADYAVLLAEDDTIIDIFSGLV